MNSQINIEMTYEDEDADENDDEDEDEDEEDDDDDDDDDDEDEDDNEDGEDEDENVKDEDVLLLVGLHGDLLPGRLCLHLGHLHQEDEDQKAGLPRWPLSRGTICRYGLP